MASGALRSSCVDCGLEIDLEPRENPAEGLAFFAANAVTEFAAEYFVDTSNVCCKRPAGGGDVNTPDTPIVRVWVALNETASFETVDDGAYRGATGAHLVSESGLRGGSELCDVGQEAGLREIEIKWFEPGVERIADQARGRHQRRLDTQPRRGVEFVVREATHGPSGHILYDVIQ